MVLSWINRSFSPHIAQSTICFDSAFDLWEDLRERFTKGNHFRFSDLLRDLHSIKQGDHSLSQYFTDLKILWDGLEDLRPTPSCSCIVPFTCNLVKVVRIYKHMEYVMGFLKGLNDSYHDIRAQILLLDPLSNISRAYSLIAQKQVVFPSPVNTTLTVLYSNNSTYIGRGRGRTQTKGSMLYTHYNKTTHTVESCYFKHGFTPENRLRNKKTSDSKPLHNADKDGVISKKDYQHLFLLLQRSKKNAQQSTNDKGLSSHTISGIFNKGTDFNLSSMWILDRGGN
ncbi:uncharacterized protein LOC127087758 [Lathyrus oleraceus]|uniref:uncharacterized protein LOC127087758 n=1 Tax=Pisum sativum TaxID=3888 RepID=UPI0021D2E3E9|nr:uncharacterized protein LOC127087758 [Pisum sativum]